LTKDQIVARLARHLVDDRISALTWAQLILAVQAMTTEQRAALLAAVQNRATQQIGDTLKTAVQNWARTQAQADAATMLANDVLSLDDLEKILRA
jgi:uncharacterized protein YpbB